jgi:hypothetical protein
LRQTPQNQKSHKVVQKMAEVIVTILVMAVGAAIGIGSVILLLYLFAD